MPPAAIAAAVVATGVAGQLIESNQQANSAERIASAQQGAAKGLRGDVMAAAKPTAWELDQMQSQMNIEETQLRRHEALLASVDPALMEAGQQALKLLRGQEASTLGPLRQERDRQRNLLMQRMHEQLGAGAEQSTAGIEQLNRFDSETAQIMNNAQQDSLRTLLGTSLSTESQANLNQDIGAHATILGELGGWQQRQINGLTGTNLTPYAGAPFVGDLARAQGMGRAFSGLTQIGGMALGNAAFGAAGAGSASGMAPGSAGMTAAETTDLSSNLNELQALNRNQGATLQ